MLSLHARGAVGKVVTPVAARLARAGVSPDVITIIGTVGVAGAALAFYPRGHFLVGTLVIVAFVFSDTLDGAIARQTEASSVWGAFLDSTLDRIGDAAVFGSLVLWYAGGGHSRLYAGLALLCLAAGSVTSYIKARAESLGLSANVGFAERAERLIIVLACAGLAGLFHWPWLLQGALWFLAGATVLTVGQRLVEVRRQAAKVGGIRARRRPMRPRTARMTGRVAARPRGRTRLVARPRRRPTVADDRPADRSDRADSRTADGPGAATG
jgi:CDP-diacylglycerol--glycerol-3-phosphate 3-phosphatidyltransferase